MGSGLCHVDTDKLFLGIDPEKGASVTCPHELARRAGHTSYAVALTHCKAKAKRVAGSSQQKLTRHVRALAEAMNDAAQKLAKNAAGDYRPDPNAGLGGLDVRNAGLLRLPAGLGLGLHSRRHEGDQGVPYDFLYGSFVAPSNVRPSSEGRSPCRQSEIVLDCPKVGGSDDRNPEARSDPGR